RANHFVAKNASFDDGPCGFPGVGLHLGRGAITKIDGYEIAVVVGRDFIDASECSIDPTIAGIITEHHDLSTDLERQALIGGWIELTGIPRGACVVGVLVGGEWSKLE